MVKDGIIIGGVSADKEEIEDIQYIMNISFISHRMRTLTHHYDVPVLIEETEPQSTKKATGSYDSCEKAYRLFSVRGLT